MLGKFRKEIKQYQAEVVKEMLKLATAGFGLVAALAWNELIKNTINEFFPTQHSNILSLFIYAFIVTILAVFVTLQLTRLSEKLEEEKKKEAK